jgi:hypothetical protein
MLKWLATLSPVMAKVMSGLLYPAVSGAAFYLLLQRFVTQDQSLKTPTFWIGALISVYFVYSFLAIENARAEYKRLNFFLDLTHLVAIFYVFNQLGFVENKDSTGRGMSRAYFAIAAMFFVDSMWRLRINPVGFGSSFAGQSRMIIAVLAILLYLFLGWLNAPMESSAHWLAVTFLAAMMFIYEVAVRPKSYSTESPRV